jgi:two-component system, chemotaxis family, protein-glutamate methylesterase/glutaminase
MVSRDIVVVGASAGGVEALQRLARDLPADFPGTIFVTVHFPEHGTSALPQILNRAGPVRASHAADGDPIEPGRIYIAPPDHHLLLSRGGVRTVRGPRENGHRPAIDPMFRSAAAAFGPRVIGVVLTGNLDDGTSGIAAVRRAGGLGVAQDPDEALFRSMPDSVIRHAGVDRVSPLGELAATLVELMREPHLRVAEATAADDVRETELSALSLEAMADTGNHPGRASLYGCPDCGGVLWQLEDGELTRFRCRVGHAWTADALLLEQLVQFDEALWVALRTLEESAGLAAQLAKKQRDRGHQSIGERFERQANELNERAEIIRAALIQGPAAQPTRDIEPAAETATARTGTH